MVKKYFLNKNINDSKNKESLTNNKENSIKLGKMKCFHRKLLD